MDYNKNFTNQQYQKTILQNGLTILTVNKDDIASVSIEVWIKVGSRYENQPLSGLAHFIEHMNFKGTSKRTAQKIAEDFDAIGGYLNAYTSKEHTVYSAKVLKEFLPLTIEILSDIIFNSIYDEEEIKKEKNVVLQELAQTKDTPDDLVFEFFSEISFINQSLGRSILGTEKNITSFTREQIISFIKQYYIAENIIVSAAGNIEHKELVQLLSENFIPFPNQSHITMNKAIYTGGCKYQEDLELEQLHLVIGYEGTAINSEEYYKLEMLSNILGGSISSRLFQEIREKRGLVYSVSSFCQHYTDTGIFGISVSASANKTTELLQVLSNEINKISQAITIEEVTRCLAQVKAALYMSRETADSLVGILAGNYSYYGRYISENEIWQKYSQIQIDDLKSLAKKIFTKDKKIAISALGDIKFLPDYEQIQKLLTI